MVRYDTSVWLSSLQEKHTATVSVLRHSNLHILNSAVIRSHMLKLDLFHVGILNLPREIKGSGFDFWRNMPARVLGTP